MLLSTLQGIIGVLFAFSVAIFVHELGHFMFAKLFGVKVDTFSLGFGKKLLKFRRGDTEYCISAIPFGGYVKMVGTLSKELEDVLEGKTDATESEVKTAEIAATELTAPAPPPISMAEGIQDEVNALRNKPYWQKLLVFSAGCINNILTAVLIYFLVMWIGYNAPPPADPVVGRIRNIPEAVSPLKAEDRIVSISDTPVKTFDDFVLYFANKETPEEFTGPAAMQIVRDGTTMPLELPLIAPVVPPLPAGKILAVGDTEVDTALDAGKAAARLLENETTGTVNITVQTANGTTTVNTMPIAATGPWWPVLTIIPNDPARIELVLPNLPAEKSGIQIGDIILSIDGKPVNTSHQASSILRDMPGQTAQLLVERGEGKSEKTTETIALEVRANPDNANIGQIGVLFGGQRTVFIQKPFFEALKSAFVRTGDMIVAYKEALAKIFGSSFRTIRENLAGPIGISVQFFKTAQSGWFHFILTFAMFNIVLALTNLLPLPVLDGGHILFATIEAITRRPLPAKVMVAIYNTFTFLIIALALMITFNDVIMNSWRLPFFGK